MGIAIYSSFKELLYSLSQYERFLGSSFLLELEGGTHFDHTMVGILNFPSEYNTNQQQEIWSCILMRIKIYSSFKNYYRVPLLSIVEVFCSSFMLELEGGTHLHHTMVGILNFPSEYNTNQQQEIWSCILMRIKIYSSFKNYYRVPLHSIIGVFCSSFMLELEGGTHFHHTIGGIYIVFPKWIHTNQKQETLKLYSHGYYNLLMLQRIIKGCA